MSATHTQSLFGCTAIVTGVSPGGIGLHTAIGLCKAGAHVVLACRDQGKAEAAATHIRSVVKPAAIVDVMTLDLSSLASIRRYDSFMHMKVWLERFARLVTTQVCDGIRSQAR
jgi:NAD(P)-dependent dehydrogenase (short-subunit alcohol dehydrogenase family)